MLGVCIPGTLSQFSVPCFFLSALSPFSIIFPFHRSAQQPPIEVGSVGPSAFSLRVATNIFLTFLSLFFFFFFIFYYYYHRFQIATINCILYITLLLHLFLHYCYLLLIFTHFRYLLLFLLYYQSSLFFIINIILLLFAIIPTWLL